MEAEKRCSVVAPRPVQAQGARRACSDLQTCSRCSKGCNARGQLVGSIATMEEASCRQSIDERGNECELRAAVKFPDTH